METFFQTPDDERFRGGSRVVEISKMRHFVIIVSSLQDGALCDNS